MKSRHIFTRNNYINRAVCDTKYLQFSKNPISLMWDTEESQTNLRMDQRGRLLRPPRSRRSESEMSRQLFPRERREAAGGTRARDRPRAKNPTRRQREMKRSIARCGRSFLRSDSSRPNQRRSSVWAILAHLTPHLTFPQAVFVAFPSFPIKFE